jgi:hypothetical protein
MVDELNYDVPVGTEFGPFEHPLDATAMDMYLKGSGNVHPWHREGSSYRPVIAPPGMLGNLTLRLIDSMYILQTGTLHAKQELEFHHPVRLDGKLISRGRIADKYERRGRKWIVFEADFSDGEGKLLASSRVVLTLALPLAEEGDKK